jgi:hypothetical protein
MDREEESINNVQDDGVVVVVVVVDFVFLTRSSSSTHTQRYRADSLPMTKNHWQTAGKQQAIGGETHV